MTRVVVLTSPRSGTHFVVRSIATSGGFPFDVTPYLRDGLPSSSSWVVGTHEPFPDVRAIREAEARIVIVERSPLDHVLSYFDHPTNADSIEFVELVRRSRFVANREMHRRIDAPRFSYDDLARGNVDEWGRLSELLDIDVRPEPIETTRKAEGDYVARYGDPGRWERYLSPEIAKALLEVITPT